MNTNYPEMECVNCNKTFERFEKGYRRTSLLSKDRHEETLRDVIGSKITPKTGRADQRFLCTTCDKLFKVTVSGSQAKKELFGKTVEGSYVARKRKHSLEHTLLNIQSPQAKRSKSSPRMSTPLKVTK